MTDLAWFLTGVACSLLGTMGAAAFIRNGQGRFTSEDELHRPRLKSIRDEIDEDRVKRSERQ
jgi:hypothetical protein